MRWSWGWSIGEDDFSSGYVEFEAFVRFTSAGVEKTRRCMGLERRVRFGQVSGLLGIKMVFGKENACP